MKIGIVLSQTPQYSETFFRLKIKVLQELGYEVILFTQNRDPYFKACEVKSVLSLSQYPLWMRCFKVSTTLLLVSLFQPMRFFKFIALERQSKRSWTQIIKNLYNNSHILRFKTLNWVHFGFATIALQSEHVAKAIGAKMAVSCRGYDIDVYAELHPDCYDVLWAKVDKIHSISNYLLQKAYTLGLDKSTPSMVITPAVDIKLFSNEWYKFRTSNEKITITTVGRLHPIKGLKFSIEAAVFLKQAGLNFEYLIIGDGPEYSLLQKQIDFLKLKDYVFLKGRKSQEALKQILQVTDVYVQYSISEGFCNSVLESQAMGLLTIVSDGGALPENVIDKQTGWVVPKKNAKLLAEAILNIINLPESTKAEVRAASRQRVLDLFSIDKHQKLFKAFYEND